jgi:hypothetical protein
VSDSARSFNREELAWAAGFFDGEGHFGTIKTGKNNLHLHIQVVQTVDGPLQRLQNVLGVGKIYGPYKQCKGGRRPYKQFHVDRFENVQHALCLMWPWLSAPKRAQAKAAILAYHEYLARPHIPCGPKRKVHEQNAA